MGKNESEGGNDDASCSRKKDSRKSPEIIRSVDLKEKSKVQQGNESEKSVKQKD